MKVNDNKESDNYATLKASQQHHFLLENDSKTTIS